MSSARSPRLAGAGLGLRRALLPELASLTPEDPAPTFLELAPENWLRASPARQRQLRALTERYPFAAHGLSLSIGSPDALDENLLAELKRFLDTHGIADYSDHLSFCSADGQLYDLMPIPFTGEAVRQVAQRVRQVQQQLDRRIALENASYYLPLATELSEAAFITAVVEEADCDLLLDINNVVVNSVNHGYDAAAFLAALPLERVRYLHLAGHAVEADDLRVDTHGSPVDEPTFALLAACYARLGPLPTLLERDFEVPPLAVLLAELQRIRSLQAAAA